jgi:hypothetical protein
MIILTFDFYSHDFGIYFLAIEFTESTETY